VKTLNVPRDTIGSIVWKLKAKGRLLFGCFASSGTGNLHMEGKMDSLKYKEILKKKNTKKKSCRQ